MSTGERSDDGLRAVQQAEDEGAGGEAALRSALARTRAELEAAKVAAQEADHRAKNVIMLAKSVLDMQRTIETEPRAREILAGAGRRLIALSTLHDRLRPGEHGPGISIQAYLDKLVATLGFAEEGLGARVLVSVSLEEAVWPLAVARPFLILASEAITNAVVHGLAGGAGQVVVTLAPGQGNEACLIVEDDGRGLPDDHKRGFGMRLMEFLATQLGGRIAVAARVEGGTTLRVDFPRPQPA